MLNRSMNAKKNFESHGVRYSELLRLPYWDPTTFTILDTMHAMFLDNLKRHCRTIWGMDVKFQDGDGTEMEPSVWSMNTTLT